MIDKQSPIPIYHQIEETIKALIDNGELKPGDALPSENEYTNIFQVSRMTVRQAINNLVSLGYLYRQKGKGTFVAERKIEQTLKGLTSFTEDMKSRGMEPGSKLLKLELIPAPPSIARLLNLKEHDPIYEIKRIRLANQIPMAFETSYMPANLVKALTDEIVNHSLYNYIEDQLGLKIYHATQIIESSIVKKEEQDYLQLPKGAPVLVMERHSFLKNEQPLELVKSVYRADRYKFVIDMKR
jgi:GntR family transcriptional regulator